jgi:hypothetical protein
MEYSTQSTVSSVTDSVKIEHGGLLLIFILLYVFFQPTNKANSFIYASPFLQVNFTRQWMVHQSTQIPRLVLAVSVSKVA